MSAGVQMSSKEWGIAKSTEEDGMNRFEGEPYRRPMRNVCLVSYSTGAAVPEPFLIMLLGITPELIPWLPELRACNILD